jgi:hypothetical protein
MPRILFPGLSLLALSLLAIAPLSTLQRSPLSQSSLETAIVVDDAAPSSRAFQAMHIPVVWE